VSDAQFCPFCDVTLDLHDGPDTCHLAERKADLLAAFASIGRTR
jgi:hypothetical protein